MPRVTILAVMIVGLLSAGALAQSTEFVFSPEGTGDLADPLPYNFQNGVRGLSGPWDLDGDGLVEVLLAQHNAAGGRVLVVENSGVNTWELVYMTGIVDSSDASTNARHAVGADVDGDGNWEIVYVAGLGYDTEANPLNTHGAYIWEHDGVVGSDNYGEKPAFIADYYTADNLEGGSGRAENMDAADVDGDGRTELLIPSNGASAYDINYVVGIVGDIETDGYETTFATTNIEGRLGPRENGNAFGGGSPNAVTHGDFNGDGQMDISWMVWNYFNVMNATAAGVDSVAFADTLAENRNVRAAFPNDHVALFSGAAGDIDGDGNDEVAWPNWYTGNVTILDYADQENVLVVDEEHLAFEAIDMNRSGQSGEGIAIGDLDGDGHMEVILGGPGLGSALANSGATPSFFSIAEYNSGDVKDGASYGVQAIETPIPLDEAGFNIVMRDSAGESRQYYETALAKQGVLTIGSEDGIFPSGLVYLADADDDGAQEVALSFQGVDDTLATIHEAYNSDSLFAVFNTPDGAGEPGPIGPGGSYSFSFDAPQGSFLSFATMFVESNDLFYAPADTGIALWDSEGNMRSGDVTNEILFWDAGTELNEEPFVGPNQAPRQAGPNTGEDDTLAVVTPCCVDGYDYPAVADVIQVELDADVETGIFTVTITNVSTAGKTGATAAPLAPGVYVIGPAVSELFAEGAPASAGLEALAEDGDPSVLNEALLGDDDLVFFRTIASKEAATVRSFLRIYSMDGSSVRAESDRIVLPTDYKLSQNYPNPFNPSTTFDFTLPIDKKVSVKIFDVMGRLVTTIVNDELLSAGTHTVTWDGRDVNGQAVASGQYLYTLEYGNFRQSRTMILVK